MPRLSRILLSLSLLAVLLTGCLSSPSAPPTQDMDAIMTQAVQTVMAGLVTPTPLATETALPTTTPPPRTPPALPPVFTTGVLNPLDTPHTYMGDTCQYLQDKWNPQHAQPGTIVMVVMLHSINKDGLDDPNDITVADFKKMMDALKEQNFEAINAEQLADFLDHNAMIPPRSVVLIQDDRHYAENFNQHFRPYWEQWGWPVVTAWISAEDSIRNIVLPENIALAKEGWVDYQSHGTVHNIPMSDSSTDEYIRSEFQGSITDLQQNFNKTPVAIIWPGGGFGIRPAQIAREYGYRLGFTVNPRGPLMYNWIPLADQADPGRPSYVPEGPVGDPRMTLPRYWPNQVLPNIDVVRNIGNEAAAYAEQNKATELDYYDIVCSPSYGPIPQ
jgi:Polysaccharide deacetylase